MKKKIKSSNSANVFAVLAYTFLGTKHIDPFLVWSVEEAGHGTVLRFSLHILERVGC